MLLLLPIALLLITTGNATSKSIVNTTVEGENVNVETRIYTNVNGYESTVTTNEPGEVRVVNDGITVTVSTPSASPMQPSSPAAVPAPANTARSWFLMLKAWLANVLKRI